MRFFFLLLATRLLAAFLSPIADCDEVFNFWEPTHYLMYGIGFEPWEYSPQHALRSWLYIWLHWLLFWPLSFFSKPTVFYGGRALLATLSALVESRLWNAVSTKLGNRIAQLALAFSVLSPAMFSAVPSMLPTSFVLTCFMVSHAAWVNERSRYVLCVITAAAVAVVLGWPFAALLMVPVALDCLVRYSFIFCLIRCWPLVPLLLAVTMVDTAMYGRVVCSTWNLLWYNFLGADKSESSELYGTEPWTYFLKNLTLNFNVTFLLALMAPLLVIIRLYSCSAILKDLPPIEPPVVGAVGRAGASDGQLRQRRRKSSETSHVEGSQASNGSDAKVFVRQLIYMSPFFVWFLFWLIPAHKEERFLVPAYHLLILTAAISADALLWFATHVGGRVFLFLTYCVLLSMVPLSIARITAQVTFYGAPMQVYTDVTTHYESHNDVTANQSPARVCVGKEWYRFPSHFLLHRDLQLYFLKSKFGGLLPTHFPPHPNGTKVIHPELNRRNQAVWTLPSITDAADCTYIVDLDLKDQAEEHYAADTATWEVITKYPFLDAGRSPAWARWLFIPYISVQHNRFAPYLALHRKKSIEDEVQAEAKTEQQ